MTPLPASFSASDVARTIEHTLLRLDATGDDHARLVDEAATHRFLGVCVRPEWAVYTRARIASACTSTKLVVVVGFHDGSVLTGKKVSDVEEALTAGADEIDMVINRRFLSQREFAAAERDIHAVVVAASGRPVKVIMESHLFDGSDGLDGDDLEHACHIAGHAGAKFFKTCTGFTGGGATEEAVQRLAYIARDYPGVQVKASGGVRDLATAQRMLAAGASRIGTSSGVAIMKGFASDGGY